MPSNLTKGTGTELSAVIFGAWADLLIGQWGGLDLIVDDVTEAAKGNVRLVAHSEWDIAVRHAESFAAIQDAQNAFEGWARTPARARSDALRAWHDAILAHAEPLATVATAECGKPLAESVGEIRYGATFVEWFAEEAKRSYGEWIPPDRSCVGTLIVEGAMPPV